MGAGLYGMNRINPMISIHMIKCFVLPRLLYGLDVIRLTKTDIKNLSTYFVQHLPVRTSTAAVLILAGQIQIEAELLKLSLFRNIAENKGSMENNIAFRKLAIKPEDSDSWFIQIVKVTEMYNLPSPRDILHPVPNKAIWKRTVYTAINEYWRDQLVKDATTKSTLKLFNFEEFEIG
jgi:hypothetical protein